MKRRKLLLMLLAIVFLGFLLLFVLINENNRIRNYDDIKQKNELRVATDYGLIDYFIDGDSAAGFQYEMVQSLCAQLEVEPNWNIENSLDKNIEDLLKGKIDLIARNIPITTELKERLLFSEPIIHVSQVLVQRKADFNAGIQPIRNQLELAEKTVYVPKNSPHILRLNNLSDEIADTIHISQDQHYEVEQLMIMVARGDIDYAVADLQSAKKAAAILPELDIKTAVGFVQLQAWAMRPSSIDLKLAVDSFLIDFLQTKEYRDIYRRYY